ncbi:MULTISPECIES: hypothetical protein [unclassified Streptomyces]|uniref:hypothetical protein n=1 Tax=unclassified Streptomyces TaxID=2593676 RepID=UPI003656407A
MPRRERPLDACDGLFLEHAAGSDNGAGTPAIRRTSSETEGWLDEVEGFRVSFASAEEKLRQLDRGRGRHRAVHLGIPTARGDR